MNSNLVKMVASLVCGVVVGWNGNVFYSLIKSEKNESKITVTSEIGSAQPKSSQNLPAPATPLPVLSSFPIVPLPTNTNTNPLTDPIPMAEGTNSIPTSNQENGIITSKMRNYFLFFFGFGMLSGGLLWWYLKKQDQLIFEILNAELNEIRLRCDALQKKIEAEKKKYQQMKEEIEKLMNEKAKLQEKLDIIVETRNQEESKQRKKIIKPIYVQSRLTNLPSLKDLEKEGIFFEEIGSVDEIAKWAVKPNVIFYAVNPTGHDVEADLQSVKFQSFKTLYIPVVVLGLVAGKPSGAGFSTLSTGERVITLWYYENQWHSESVQSILGYWKVD